MDFSLTPTDAADENVYRLDSGTRPDYDGSWAYDDDHWVEPAGDYWTYFTYERFNRGPISQCTIGSGHIDDQFYGTVNQTAFLNMSVPFRIPKFDLHRGGSDSLTTAAINLGFSGLQIVRQRANYAIFPTDSIPEYGPEGRRYFQVVSQPSYTWAYWITEESVPATLQTALYGINSESGGNELTLLGSSLGSASNGDVRKIDVTQFAKNYLDNLGFYDQFGVFIICPLLEIDWNELAQATDMKTFLRKVYAATVDIQITDWIECGALAPPNMFPLGHTDVVYLTYDPILPSSGLTGYATLDSDKISVPDRLACRSTMFWPPPGLH